ncbi:MAG TPA: phage major capsid protein [Gemmatimonadales bacterium]|nr:phage major capsid protein [Gemmatimonadales bacterium]
MNVTGKKAKLESELKEATSQAKALMTTAEKENRELSAEERAKVQGHLDEAKTLKGQIERIDGDVEMRKQLDALQPKEPAAAAPGETREHGKVLSLGQAFVKSEMFAALKAGRHRNAGFTASGEFLEFGATTLDESTGSGGKLVLPDYQQGILPVLFRQIRITDMIAPGTTDSNTIEYMQETTATNAAAARAEGAAAAESTLVYTRVAETVRSIDTMLPVTNEMAEDQGQIMSFIDGRLRLFVDLTTEDQLLNGDGTGVNLTGLLNRANLAAAQARGADTNADAIFKQIMAILTSSFVMPEGVAINPANWTTIVLQKDGNGQYYGSGPFQALQTPVLWGLPASVTPAIVANTALVGAYRSCAQRFERRGVSISASNSHSDYFAKRIVALLAGRRIGLAVYRPGAFGKVTGLN